MKNNKYVSPFIKWSKDEKHLVPELEKYVPKNFTSYREPFLGGGALLFHIQPQNAVLNAVNVELLNLYTVIRDKVEYLIEDLKSHVNEKDYFYHIRSLDRNGKIHELSDVERASRMIYLNKTCFNGFFKVNEQGQFDAPFGSYKNPKIVNKIILRAVSEYFNKNNIQFTNKSFEESIKDVEKGAFVYLAPPYTPVSDNSKFANGFVMEDHMKLKELCDNLSSRGINFLLSNSSDPFVHDLYKDYNIEIIEIGRNINSISSKRGQIEEVLIRNY
ncbi:DNA adenine methylase [Peptoclostridium litorale DSM 5388]|uniref:site-specific DNA-methyltransferase (adenine-specific) n=1 Tax=Peptoclostridium litorale DSM 5388 TaxID=1121324 RepID=A0A069RBL6_PEPLI|nr:Dam family site-specific DNA-(adenine-N6)-methyltransferase [Peptoclostridium litorale]KDR94446.1 modification methylase [Peptoclostridium litorale DSM 5388]SIO23763.1 DNA adenine methylase [Peptoclostridium litorale DSM 5388]